MVAALPIQLPEIEVTSPSDDNSVKMVADKPGDVDVDSLYKTFSGKDKTPTTNVDDLYNHFTTSQAAPVEPVQPQQVHPPISGLTPQASALRNAQFEQQETANANNPSTVVGDVGNAMALPAVNFWKNTKENFNSSADLYKKGVQDLTNYQPATGISEMALGATGAALSPITGAADAFIRDPVTQLTGNPDIGNRASLLATSGLPVMKAGSLVNAALPSNRALGALVRIIGPQNLAEGLQRMRADPSLSVADVFPGVRQMTQKLVTTEGNPANDIENWVKERTAAAKGKVTDTYNDTMGMPVNVKTKLDALKLAAKNVGTKDIQPAIDGAGPVDLSGVISNIDSTLKPGVTSQMTMGKQLPFTEIKQELSQVRDMLTDNKSIRVGAKDLHSFQSNLRARADDLLNSADGKDRQIGYALMDTRNQIVDAIDKASPQIKDANGNMVGTYKTALSKYRDEKQIEDAYIKGTQIGSNRPGQWDDRPEFWEDWKNKASKEQIEAAKEGARTYVEHQMNGMRFGARKGTDIPDVAFNKDKLSLLFGDREINQMATRLQNQKDIADTNSKLIQNSQTAMRTKANSEVDLPEKKGLSLPAYLAPLIELGAAYTTGTPGLGLGVLALAKTANFAHNKISLKAQMSKNDALTKLITSKGQDREDLINVLSNHIPQQKPSMLQRARNTALPVLPP